MSVKALSSFVAKFRLREVIAFGLIDTRLAYAN